MRQLKVSKDNSLNADEKVYPILLSVKISVKTFTFYQTFFFEHLIFYVIHKMLYNLQ